MKVTIVMVSIEETMALGQEEISPDKGFYFPNPVSELPMSHTLSMYYRWSSFGVRND